MLLIAVVAAGVMSVSPMTASPAISRPVSVTPISRPVSAAPASRPVQAAQSQQAHPQQKPCPPRLEERQQSQVATEPPSLCYLRNRIADANTMYGFGVDSEWQCSPLFLGR
jgi:hypothetical protein